MSRHAQMPEAMSFTYELEAPLSAETYSELLPPLLTALPIYHKLLFSEEEIDQRLFSAASSKSQE